MDTAETRMAALCGTDVGGEPGQGVPKGTLPEAADERRKFC